MSSGHRLNKPLKGRGSILSPEPRYLGTAREALDDGWGSADLEPARLHTTVTEERIQGIINRNESPDLPFNLSINPYRGCEHGCVYCYARPAHAFMDLSPGLDFESRLFSKPGGPEVLRRELAKSHYRCETIALVRILMRTNRLKSVSRLLGACWKCWQSATTRSRLYRSLH